MGRITSHTYRWGPWYILQRRLEGGGGGSSYLPGGMAMIDVSAAAAFECPFRMPQKSLSLASCCIEVPQEVHLLHAPRSQSRLVSHGSAEPAEDCLMSYLRFMLAAAASPSMQGLPVQLAHIKMSHSHAQAEVLAWLVNATCVLALQQLSHGNIQLHPALQQPVPWWAK